MSSIDSIAMTHNKSAAESTSPLQQEADQHRMPAEKGAVLEKITSAGSPPELRPPEIKRSAKMFVSPFQTEDDKPKMAAGRGAAPEVHAPAARAPEARAPVSRAPEGRPSGGSHPIHEDRNPGRVTPDRGTGGRDRGKDQGKDPGKDQGKDQGKDRGQNGRGHDRNPDPSNPGGPGRVGPVHHQPVDHGIHKGQSAWGPPANEHWGWQDQKRWTTNYDDWFFTTQDPNFSTWEAPVKSEAAVVANLLDSGKGAEAAKELSEDLFAMKGDLYAQDELLHEIDQLEKKTVGADLQLKQWDPNRGTWGDVEIVQTGSPPINIKVYGANDDFTGKGDTVATLREDINNGDLKNFLPDVQTAFNNGTLDQALKQLKAQTAYNHTDAAQTDTKQSIDQYSAVVNSRPDSNGITYVFNLSVVTVSNADGAKIVTFNAGRSASTCN